MIRVFGSINMDVVIPVTRLPVAGETVLTPGYELVPGGKGANQAVAAARAGADVAMTGMVGKDSFGAATLAALSDAGVVTDGVGQGEGPTACAMVCVAADGENQIVVASGANRELRADRLNHAKFGRGDTMLVQLEVPLSENWRAIETAREAGATIILNAAPAAPIPASALSAIDVLIMNELEAVGVAQADGLPDNTPEQAAAALTDRHGCTSVVTLGAGGAVAFTRDRTWRVGVLAIDPIDTTAAGDAFTGCLAAELDGGADFAVALHRASVAGGLACTRLGAMVSLPEAHQIDRAAQDLPLPGVAPRTSEG